MSATAAENRALLAPLKAAMYDFDAGAVRTALTGVMASDAIVHMPYPFGDLSGPQALYDTCYAPLFAAIPDLERRDQIMIAGNSEHGDHWVGAGGYYLGTFVAPWLDIPPTGHLVHMRFHEFYRIVDRQIVEVQTLWDIPEVMMQANAWPMAPSLGREWHVPGPATQDGIKTGSSDLNMALQSRQTIVEMLDHMKRHPGQGGPEVMEMERFWHPRMTWYGPSGIGTGRGIAGFRNWHQIPFLAGMPDRGKYVDDITYHFFGEDNYAAVTGWPDMIQTVTADGWMGIVPPGKRVTMCSLDFWRIENGLIRENWVMVDILDVYAQMGVDVFRRLREFNKARVPGSVPYPVGDV